MGGPPVGRQNVWLIVLGQSISLFGDYVALLALPLFVLELTGSALDLGLTMASETLPTLLFGFAVGVALDRVHLKRALIVADLARAAAFAILAVAAATGGAQVWMAFAVAFLAGSMTVTFDAGFQAWMPALLAADDLVSVNARLQFVRTAAWAVGPATAGFLVSAGGGFPVAFAVDAASFVVSAVFVVVLVELIPRAVPKHREPWWGAFVAGMRYLRNEPRLRTATVAATAANLLFVPMEALLVLFARDRLGLDSGSMVGWFFAAHAMVGAAGVAFAPRVIERLGLGRVFVVGMVSLGGGFLILAMLAQRLAGLPGLAAATLAALPAGVSVTGVSLVNVAFTTLRQQIPPEAMRGRVIAASRTLAWAGLPVGATLGGALGERFGVRVVYLSSSLALLMLGVMLVFGALWRHEAVVVLERDPVEPARRP